jgi:hypothetical protein
MANGKWKGTKPALLLAWSIAVTANGSALAQQENRVVKFPDANPPLQIIITMPADHPAVCKDFILGAYGSVVLKGPGRFEFAGKIIPFSKPIRLSHGPSIFNGANLVADVAAQCGHKK